MINSVQYFDSPESGRWINRFDVLWLKRDHRRILNAEPRRKEVYYLSERIKSAMGRAVFEKPFSTMIHDFKVLSN